MKIIEALKHLKRLKIKADDLKEKVNRHCAHSSIEQAEYGDKQREKIREWIDSYHDTVKEILRLRVAIQKTNIQTPVSIEIHGKGVTRTIAEWIHRRRDLAAMDLDLWKKVNDNHVQTGALKPSRQDGDPIEVKSIKYYDPEIRDKKISEYREEPSIIDATLEIVNATTDITQ